MSAVIDEIAERAANARLDAMCRGLMELPSPLKDFPADLYAMHVRAMREALLSLTDDDLRELRFRDLMPPVQAPAGRAAA